MNNVRDPAGNHFSGIVIGKRVMQAGIPLPIFYLGEIKQLQVNPVRQYFGVYLLVYVPGIMDEHVSMFGLFSMTRIVDLGHLFAGALAVVAAWSSPKVARIYFYVLGVAYSIDVVTYFVSHLQTISLTKNVLVNLPHILILGAAFWIATKVDRTRTESAAPV